MAKSSRSGRWSRPATGAQIRALKAHGNYDGKYYSVGRASQSISRGVSSQRRGAYSAGSLSSRAAWSPRRAEPSASIDESFALVEDLLGDPADLLVRADRAARESLDGDAPTDEMPVESVAIDVVVDERDPSAPRIVFDAVVTRNAAHRGDAEISVQFQSNVEFGDRVPSDPPRFESGITFDE